MAASTTAQFTLDGKSWTLDLATLTMNDAILLEQRTGRTWAQMLLDFDAGSALATKALWWAARLRAGEAIAFDDPSMNPEWRGFVSRWVEPEPEPELAPVEPPVEAASA